MKVQNTIIEFCRIFGSIACCEHWNTSSKPSCFENLQSQIQVCLYVTSEILCIGGNLTCLDRTNSPKASRGGSVSTHINRRKFDFVHRSFTPFRDITRKRSYLEWQVQLADIYWALYIWHETTIL